MNPIQYQVGGIIVYLWGQYGATYQRLFKPMHMIGSLQLLLGRAQGHTRHLHFIVGSLLINAN